MSQPFSPATREVVLRAQDLAVAQKSGVVSEAHLFLAVLESESEMVSALLELSGVSREEARFYAESALEIVPPQAGKPIRLAVGAQKALHMAAIQAQSDDGTLPDPHHLFIACLAPRRGPHLGEVLGPMGLDAAKLREHLRGMKARPNSRQSGQKLTARAEKALEAAQAEMRASYCGRIGAAHLLLGLLIDRENIAVEMLQKAGCDLEDLQKRARESIKSDGEIAMPQKRFSPGAKRALERASRAAKRANHKFIDCGDLLLGLLPGRETLGERWRSRGRKLDSVEALWTAEEALALRGALENSPKGVAVHAPKRAAHQDFKLTPPASGSKASLRCGLASFIVGSLWAAVLTSDGIGNRSSASLIVLISGLIVLFVSGLGTCVVMLLSRSPQTKETWMSIFAGWMVGLMAGSYLRFFF